MLIRSLLKNEADLLARCQQIEGLTLAQLAVALQSNIPNHPLQRKGWAGQAIELALGATAGSHAQPDFFDLGIELKTLPVNHLGKPAESTFVTSISLLTIHQETWETSQCFAKLKRVLWLPIEADKRLAFPHRRIGRAILWSPSQEQEAILAEDWSELSWMISSGKLAEIDARLGQYLQVRPKAANGQSLCYGYDESGNKILTLPRGFYLRSSFTATILS
ncbi:DNA mismatch repair endonuclease MutH [Legionella oakridgensis]|uniref:DNA mismatch repair protein MutH n=2 Tax=Legionella oakridgensis TaxID=29423 RepID=W0BC22_9GAMM|nr:DNA mismatch repair endonuclease MutH [Legionella oakridgensis]AHE67390.1 DNA mismatch repair endonuclease MutH [Legionella oakridgensis ATCC 33761 = DSM 21215]ETO92929.1 DNA mismatch repair protein MutH [Legionella oakridgensis RV-2-2007]KTD43458.1 DNA mismatch repair protein [Legionella oakridgensis]STY20449.1 DNA mismatch repair protein MutH [Legionella longbeachae]